MVSKIVQLLDTWYLMRIITLAEFVISKQKPIMSFAFTRAWNLCEEFLYAREAATITRFALGKHQERPFKFLFATSKQLNFDVEARDFSEALRKLDMKRGVFMLAHWLTYIFDYQERADYVWSRFPLFYSMAWELLDSKRADDLKELFIGENWLMDPWTGQRFKHRFHELHELNKVLFRTLERLCKYEGSLTVYLDKMLRECSCLDKGNWIRLLAAALNMLTYEEREISDLCKYSKEKDFLLSKNADPRKLQVGGHKRLWSALRDYILDPYFRLLLIDGLSPRNHAKSYLQSLNESLVKNESHLSQLELPGDEWNKDFWEEHVSKLKNEKPELKKIIIKDSLTSARRLFEWLNQKREYSNRVPLEKLFPVYLDVTYDLRENDLELLVNKSNEIRSKIKDEIGELETDQDVINAYNIVRRELSK